MGVVQAELELLAPPEPSFLLVLWRRFRRHRMAVAGLVILSLLILGALVIPLVSPYTFDQQDLSNMFGNPSPAHPLGTDELGRDTLTRLAYAGRISLLVSFTAMLFTIVIGTVVGVVAGFFGGWVDAVSMRIVDLMLSLPTLPLLIIFSKMFGTTGNIVAVLLNMVIILTIFGWMPAARLVRGTVLSLRGQDFVEAARALGASNLRIMFRHLVPNSMAPIIVQATLSVGAFIITESALSFLGLGIQPPVPSWGNMLYGVQQYMWSNPWLAIYPGACIFLTVLSLNFVGDALRDSLDPRLKL